MKAKGEIRLLVPDEPALYVPHMREADADSGENGAHFHVYSKSEAFDFDAAVQRYETLWARDLTETGWRRTWGWLDGERLLGSLSLSGANMLTARHRAQMGMGLLPAHRGQGGGTRLIETMVAWARSQIVLSWIDLGVFEDNPRAHALYKRLGFKELGRRPDAYRVDGKVLDDIMMSLCVGDGIPSKDGLV